MVIPSTRVLCYPVAMVAMLYALPGRGPQETIKELLIVSGQGAQVWNPTRIVGPDPVGTRCDWGLASGQRSG